MEARKTCLVTGANSGIGREAARGLLAEGFVVIMLCRNPDKAFEAQADVCKTTGSPLDRAPIVLCDLQRQDDIRRAAQEILQRFPRLDALINNAGLMNTDRLETPDGHEATFAVNHLAPFLLTHLLRPRLEGSSPSRIITVSSGMHWRGKVDFDDLESKRGYSQFGVYANTKLMNVLFTRELSRRLVGTGVTANAMHPGLVHTNFGPQKGLLKALQPLARPFMISATQGADTAVWLASNPAVAAVSGEYFAKRKIAPSSPRSKDLDLARRLWDASAHLTGIA